MTEAALTFEVGRSDWKQTRFVEGPIPELASGQVLFRVDRFALTSNNISYALSGDMLGYWRFFPCEEGWGRIPVMGFADVIRSTHSGVQRARAASASIRWRAISWSSRAPCRRVQIMDAAPHRAGLVPVYAQYLPTTGDAIYAARREDQILLMRGLFMTSFLADDFLADQDYRGARSVLISSASSKTSIALAFQVKQARRARARSGSPRRATRSSCAGSASTTRWSSTTRSRRSRRSPRCSSTWPATAPSPPPCTATSATR